MRYGPHGCGKSRTARRPEAATRMAGSGKGPSVFVRISFCPYLLEGMRQPRIRPTRTATDKKRPAPLLRATGLFLYLWAGQTVIMPDSSPVWRGVVRAVSAGDEDALQASTAPQRAPFRVQKAASTSRASCPRARTRNSGGLRRPGPSRAPSRPARRRSPRKRAAPWPVRARAWAGWRTAGAS